LCRLWSENQKLCPRSETGRSKTRRFGSGALLATFAGLMAWRWPNFGCRCYQPFASKGWRRSFGTRLTRWSWSHACRASVHRLCEIGAQWPIIVDLLAGSIPWRWVGGGWGYLRRAFLCGRGASRLKSETLYRVIAVMLVVIVHHLLDHDTATSAPPFTKMDSSCAGTFWGGGEGFITGVSASCLAWVGECLIPRRWFLRGADIKLAGTYRSR